MATAEEQKRYRARRKRREFLLVREAALTAGLGREPSDGQRALIQRVASLQWDLRGFDDRKALGKRLTATEVREKYSAESALRSNLRALHMSDRGRSKLGQPAPVPTLMELLATIRSDPDETPEPKDGSPAPAWNVKPPGRR
jgi:hypothetical protein